MATGNMAAYAAHLGVARQYVSQLKKEGRIVMVDGQVDFEASDRMAKATRQFGSANNGANARRSQKDAPAEKPDTSHSDRVGAVYRQSQAQQKAFAAKLSELEFKRRSGALLDRARVEAGIFEAFRGIRDRVLAVPRRVAPTVVNVESVREIELAIEDELRRALGADDAVEAIRAKVVP